MSQHENIPGVAIDEVSRLRGYILSKAAEQEPIQRILAEDRDIQAEQDYASAEVRYKAHKNTYMYVFSLMPSNFYLPELPPIGEVDESPQELKPARVVAFLAFEDEHVAEATISLRSDGGVMYNSYNHRGDPHYQGEVDEKRAKRLRGFLEKRFGPPQPINE